MTWKYGDGARRRPKPLILGPKDPRRPLAKRQGLSRSDVAALVRSQEGLCALCRRPLGEDFTIDHDHLLGEAHGHAPEVGCPRCVRGAACYRCNNWLGTGGEDPEFYLRAARYVARRRTA